MIDFRVEWQDAPGVRDPVLARTWCRLSIAVSGHVVTHAFDRRTRNLRDGVYGTAFPLCSWIVDNWWLLQQEAYPLPRPYGSRDLAKGNAYRSWVRRHSLLAALEGGALPDLALFRDGDKVVARWLRDGGDATHPFLRFIAEGEARMAPNDAAEGLARFVECVLERVADVDADEVRQLHADWAELVSGLTGGEQDLCTWAARMGVNAHYQDELADSDADVLRTKASSLHGAIRDDLLDVATIRGFAEDVAWIEEAGALACAQRRQGGPSAGVSSASWQRSAETAHGTGYACARALRNDLAGVGEDVVGDLPSVMRELGWAHDPQVVTDGAPASPLDAMLAFGEGGVPVVVAHAREDAKAVRFRLARSLYMHHCIGQRVAPRHRLVTSAHTWDQRASRAFAAEFLAPAEALSRRVQAPVSNHRMEELGEEFGVSSLVIAHQVDNHRLATAADA